ncbi:GMC family oxidoreductase [Antarcticirhabdus aurantiaca]|uniref:GMC family oxidoreductase N-terminal domain-containing protein n=1 Tax=Antarcticirhabdus aurantiaca TaxID=2606717 RepID=A0ACD4NNA1_9HYPH|nr:GMC family oxidoreductase N-terminal domain-containing protein [Antarcticirhabdus aurantiaca]WAJ28346.1 GMC family oxidoreductase N-terminal domain-containing protein [Jeongeuplla avenae]
MTSETGDALEFDYVVVGAGSAGCVLANRLSADPAARVCLVEGGGQDRTPRIHVPAGTITLYKSDRYAYQFMSEPQEKLNGRRVHVPRGRMLGGSSSMNSMIYIRGDRSDYDGWAAMGCPGWAFDDVLPVFKRFEDDRLGLDPAFHGTGGELAVDRPRDPNPASRRFVEAAREVGMAENPDFNGARLEGVGLYNVTQANARRLSSYRAFVHPVRGRANLTVMTDARVDGLDLEGARVRGIVVTRNGRRLRLGSRRETVLAAGALGSPEILLRSGIGDAGELGQAGIEPRHHLPGVGRNLQDHLDGLVTVRSADASTLGFSAGSAPRILASPLRYLASKAGWLTTNYVEAGGFARTRFAGAVPDVQFHFVPGYRSHRGRLFEWGHGYAIHTCVLRPESRGRVFLKPGPEGPSLAIDFRFLDKEQDGRVLVEGMKLARSILAASSFAPIRGAEIAPGPKRASDEDLMAYVRSDASTVFHPSGTCRMGSDDLAVTGPDLKVRGLHGLRVADASIMPTLVSGNTNAPSIMIGEKCAAMMLADR